MQAPTEQYPLSTLQAIGLLLVLPLDYNLQLQGLMHGARLDFGQGSGLRIMLLFSRLHLNGLLLSVALCLLSLQIQQRLMIVLIDSICFKLYLMILGFHRVHLGHWCIYTRMFSNRQLLMGSCRHLFLSIWECVRAVQPLLQCLVCSLIGLRS